MVRRVSFEDAPGVLEVERACVADGRGMVRDAGFARAAYRNLTLGVAAIHSGWKI